MTRTEAAPPSGVTSFSVVVPAFDEAGQLGATLRSLAAQDFPGTVEVIVVDNASTDGTAAVAHAHGARVVSEPLRGVCRARQRGAEEARGEVVVSTDADTVHPHDWLSRIAAQLAHHPEAVAVAGPCRYLDPPTWVDVLSRFSFAVIGRVFARTGRLGYVTATNLAFRREAFPGYAVHLTQGGDEVDFLRRLKRRGPVVWDGDNAVLTSARRLDQGLAHTLVVSFGWHYAASMLLNRATARTVLGPAPAIRAADLATVRRRRLAGRAVAALLGAAVVVRLVRGRR